MCVLSSHLSTHLQILFFSERPIITRVHFRHLPAVHALKCLSRFGFSTPCRSSPTSIGFLQRGLSPIVCCYNTAVVSIVDRRRLRLLQGRVGFYYRTTVDKSDTLPFFAITPYVQGGAFLRMFVLFVQLIIGRRVADRTAVCNDVVCRAVNCALLPSYRSTDRRKSEEYSVGVV